MQASPRLIRESRRDRASGNNRETAKNMRINIFPHIALAALHVIGGQEFELSNKKNVDSR